MASESTGDPASGGREGRRKVSALADQVVGFLVEIGLDPDQCETGPYFFRFEQAVVLVSLFSHDERAYVRISATLLKDFRPTLDLVTRVLRLNTEVLFGAFLLFEDHTLAFATTLQGDGLTCAQFKGALEYVAQVANEHCEELCGVAGGQSIAEILGEPEP